MWDFAFLQYLLTEQSNWWPVWPDLAKFRHFANILKDFGNFWRAYLEYAIGQIFIVVNGQNTKQTILSIRSHCVTRMHWPALIRLNDSVPPSPPDDLFFVFMNPKLDSNLTTYLLCRSLNYNSKQRKYFHRNLQMKFHFNSNWASI